MPQQEYCVVIGAGVVGLTTALELLKRNYQVVVVAQHLPGDEDPDYTSPWAGAHWRSIAAPDDKRQQELDASTLKYWLQLEREHGTSAGLMLVTDNQYYQQAPEGQQQPWWHDLVGNYRQLEASELPAGVTSGVTYTTITCNPAVHLRWLQGQIEGRGGRLIRARLADWSDVLRVAPRTDGQSAPRIVVNCTGNGARTLGGVNDTACLPTRGQTVIVRRPGFRKCMAFLYRKAGDTVDQISYVIPRHDGLVVLGGTYQHYNCDIRPDPETAHTIIERALAIFPDLVDPETGRLEIVRHAVGLRPSRINGIRIEAQEHVVHGRPVMLVHNYGHGGQGYQSSWASAQEVVKLLEHTSKPHIGPSHL